MAHTHTPERVDGRTVCTLCRRAIRYIAAIPGRAGYWKAATPRRAS